MIQVLTFLGYAAILAVAGALLVGVLAELYKIIAGRV